MNRMVSVKCSFCGKPALRCTQAVIDAARKRGLRAACDACCDEEKMSDSFQDEFEHEMEGLS